MKSLESSLIHHLRVGESASRIELARAMDLAPSTVGLYVDRLIDEGFLREGAKLRPSAGRPRVLLELNPHAGQFVGVEFEARQLSAVSLDFSNQTLKRRRERLRASDTAETVLSRIEEAIQSTIVRGRRLLGVGVAVPGAVDNDRGVAVHYEFIRNWRDVPVVDRLVDRFGVPVFLENNVRAIALAERWFGLARNVDNFVCLGIRSGIGAGVLVNGELYHGQNNFAGEIGGWVCSWDGAGAGRTLERQASVKAILEQLHAEGAAGRSASSALRGQRAVTVEAMLQAARDGDPLVRQVLSRAAKTLGVVISQLSLLLNPEQVVIAGPLAELGDLFLEPMREAAEQLSPPLHAQTPRIVASQLGDYAGAIGAAAMAVNQWEPAS